MNGWMNVWMFIQRGTCLVSRSHRLVSQSVSQSVSQPSRQRGNQAGRESGGQQFSEAVPHPQLHVISYALCTAPTLVHYIFSLLPKLIHSIPTLNTRNPAYVLLILFTPSSRWLFHLFFAVLMY
jgi:hypothetical protein